MYNLDKVLNNIQPEVVRGINAANRQQLEQWLHNLDHEMARIQEFMPSYNTYHLEMEKVYIQYRLG
jgi:hypothetical protein